MNQTDRPNRLFQPTITGQGSWAQLFQSIEAFTPLIEAIYARHGLAFGPVRNLTPGTNAVFRVQDTVVKLFAPEESGFSTGEDYAVELAAMSHAADAGVSAPKLLCAGSIEDSYLFRYLVMGYLEGAEAEQCLPGYATEQKLAFAQGLKAVTTALNTACHRPVPALTLAGCLVNTRWEEFPASLCEERQAFLRGLSFPDPVFTHGDLTGENLLVDPAGVIQVIDFADSRLAPTVYEWPPIVFALFGCDPVMMEAYFGEYRRQSFYDLLTEAVLIHEYGATLLRQMCANAGVPQAGMGDVAALRQFLQACVESGNMKVR